MLFFSCQSALGCTSDLRQPSWAAWWPPLTMTQGSPLNNCSGNHHREDFERESGGTTTFHASEKKTTHSSTHVPSTGFLAKPSLKGPLSPHNVFNYAFLGHQKLALIVLGENRFTTNPPKAWSAFPPQAGLQVAASRQHHPQENTTSSTSSLGSHWGKCRAEAQG